MGGVFALFMPLGLLNSEGTGLEYTKALPVKTSRIIASKALISIATYVPVPLALFLMAFMKPLSSPTSILIPCVAVVAIASASIIEIRLFLGFSRQGRVALLLYDLGRLMAGVTVGLIPLVVYALTYLLSGNHVSAILAMSSVAATEMAVAVHLLRQS
jgi:predicted permease